ncbi:MAG: hypothetical protein GXP16_05720 [Gammaproteobacteria bacterium]|nr:hypothetical protein [Gammaproteobacteria bacterium]
MSASTLDDYNRAIHNIFKDWKTRPVQSINNDMNLHRHRRLAKERGELRGGPAFSDTGISVMDFPWSGRHLQAMIG